MYNFIIVVTAIIFISLIMYIGVYSWYATKQSAEDLYEFGSSYSIEVETDDVALAINAFSETYGVSEEKIIEIAKNYPMTDTLSAINQAIKLLQARIYLKSRNIEAHVSGSGFEYKQGPCVLA